MRVSRGPRGPYLYGGERGGKRTAPMSLHAFFMLFNVLAWDMESKAGRRLTHHEIAIGTGEEAELGTGRFQLSSPWDASEIRCIFRLNVHNKRARFSTFRFKQTCYNVMKQLHNPYHLNFVEKLCRVFLKLTEEAPPTYWQSVLSTKKIGEVTLEKRYQLLNATLDALPQNNEARAELEDVLDDYVQLASSAVLLGQFRLPFNTPAHNMFPGLKQKQKTNKRGYAGLFKLGLFEYRLDPVVMLVDEHKRKGIFSSRHL